MNTVDAWKSKPVLANLPADSQVYVSTSHFRGSAACHCPENFAESCAKQRERYVMYAACLDTAVKTPHTPVDEELEECLL